MLQKRKNTNPSCECPTTETASSIASGSVATINYHPPFILYFSFFLHTVAERIMRFVQSPAEVHELKFVRRCRDQRSQRRAEGLRLTRALVAAAASRPAKVMISLHLRLLCVVAHICLFFGVCGPLYFMMHSVPVFACHRYCRRFVAKEGGVTVPNEEI